MVDREELKKIIIQDYGGDSYDEDFEEGICIKEELDDKSVLKNIIIKIPNDGSLEEKLLIEQKPIRHITPKSLEDSSVIELSDDSSSANETGCDSVFEHNNTDIASYAKPLPENLPSVEVQVSKATDSYCRMITKAILSSPGKSISLQKLFAYIYENYPLWSEKSGNWQALIENYLCHSHHFIKVLPKDFVKGSSDMWIFKPTTESKLMARFNGGESRKLLVNQRHLGTDNHFNYNTKTKLLNNRNDKNISYEHKRLHQNKTLSNHKNNYHSGTTFLPETNVSSNSSSFLHVMQFPKDSSFKTCGKYGKVASVNQSSSSLLEKYIDAKLNENNETKKCVKVKHTKPHSQTTLDKWFNKILDDGYNNQKCNVQIQKMTSDDHFNRARNLGSSGLTSSRKQSNNAIRFINTKIDTEIFEISSEDENSHIYKEPPVVSSRKCALHLSDSKIPQLNNESVSESSNHCNLTKTPGFNDSSAHINTPDLSDPSTPINTPDLSAPSTSTNTLVLSVPSNLTNTPILSVPSTITKTPALSVPSTLTNSPILSVPLSTLTKTPTLSISCTTTNTTALSAPLTVANTPACETSSIFSNTCSVSASSSHANTTSLNTPNILDDMSRSLSTLSNCCIPTPPSIPTSHSNINTICAPSTLVDNDTQDDPIALDDDIYNCPVTTSPMLLSHHQLRNHSFTPDSVSKSFTNISSLLTSLLSTPHQPNNSALFGQTRIVSKNNHASSQSGLNLKSIANSTIYRLLQKNKYKPPVIKKLDGMASTRRKHTGSIFCECNECKRNKVVSKETSLNVLKCIECDKTFSSKQCLNKHLDSHVGLKNHVCVICCKGFSSKHSLEVHKEMIHSTSESIKCPSCEKLFKSSRSLTLHIKNYHTDKVSTPTSCDLCQKIFKNKSRMRDHRRQAHTCGDEFICNDCSAVYRNRDQFINHVMMHMPPTVKCTMCSELFHNEKKLEKHMRIQHLIDNRKTFICDICGKTIKSKFALNNHMLIHKEEKSHVCEECGKSFRTATNLVQHSISHSDKRPFTCDHCGKSFRIRHHLRQHMAVHGLNTTPRYGKH